MNKLFNKITLITAVASGVFLVSCQNEDPEAVIAQASKDAGLAMAPPSMIPASRLVKYDNDTLIYNANGQIKKVITFVENTKYVTEYKYAINSIIATRYRNDKAYLILDWQLENGRAVKFTHKNFETGGLSGVSKSFVDYQYNNQNQLVKVLVHNAGGKYTGTISYDNKGNAIKFLFVKNTDKGDEFSELIKYEYTDYVGGSMEHDKGSTINLDVFGPHTMSWMGDQYLPIFGNFGKNLLKKIIPQDKNNTFKYIYSKDANGYVKERKTLSEDGGFISATKLKYLILTQDRPDEFILSK